MEINIRKALCFISIFSLFTCNVLGQSIPFALQKSEIFSDEYRNSKLVLTEEDGAGGLFILRNYKSSGLTENYGFYLEHYDSALKLVKTSEYEMSTSLSQRGKIFVGYFSANNNINIVDLLYNTVEKAYICSINSINTKTFKLQKKELLRLTKEEAKALGGFSLTKIQTEKLSTVRDESDKNAGIYLNWNKSKTAFSIAIDMNSDKSEVFKLYLFNSTLNKTFETVFKRDIKDKKFLFQNIDVDEDGKCIYLLGKVFPAEKRKNDTRQYVFELTKISEGRELKQTIDIENHYSSLLKIIIDDTRIVGVGFYSDKSETKYKGICFFELDPTTLDIRKSKFNPFTTQFLIDKYGDENQKELKNLIFKSFFITQKKDIVFNAEEYYVITTGNGMNGGTYTSYHYDDIVSAKISLEGEMVWARNINKRNNSESDESFVSYTSTIKDNIVFFFINAADKIKKLSNGNILFDDTKKNKSNLNIIRINSDSTFDYQEILSEDSSEVPFMVHDGAVSLKTNSVLFLGKKGKKKQVLKITL